LKKFIASIFILAWLIPACETNPPSAPTEGFSYGKVFVSADIPRAKIFVDGEFTKRFTPDTLTLTIGKHLISVTKDSFETRSKEITIIKDSLLSIFFKLQNSHVPKVVLLEDFSNVSCPPCVESNRILESLVKKIGSEKVIKIKYATNFPSPNDPFYLAASEYEDARIRFYNIFSAPQIVVDGLIKPQATDSTAIETAINTRLHESPSLNISVNSSLFGNSLNVNVTILNLTDTLSNENLRLFVVLTEKEIDFTNPPGSNGETKFYDVMRTIISGKNGEALKNPKGNSEQKFSYSINIAPSWNSEQLKVIAFVQDFVTKEILQASN